MTLNRRGMILSVTALAMAPGAALAADKQKPPPPAKKVFPYYDLYLGIPAAERTRFVMNYYLRVNGKPATGQDSSRCKSRANWWSCLTASSRQEPLSA